MVKFKEQAVEKKPGSTKMIEYNPTEFVSQDDIENWCYTPRTCKFVTLRRGVNKRNYEYCQKYQGPCFVHLNSCKEDKAVELRERRELEKQKTITDFCGKVIS